jgi:hypothetical protein
VPVENRLGEEGEGFVIAMSSLENGRFTVGAGACGTIRACLDYSVTYANQREAFGQQIGKFQLVQQMIAKMYAKYEAGRLLYFKAGWLKNRGEPSNRAVSLAKWYACDAAFEAASDAVEVHGAYGYSDEYPVFRYLRNSKAPIIYEGTREIHTVLQGEYALGYRTDRRPRCTLPLSARTRDGSGVKRMEVTVPNHALQGTLVLANRLAPAGQVVIEDGLIQEIVTDGRRYGPTDGSGDACISPVLIDLHIHGIAGADVMDCSQESLDLMTRHFAGHGVTGPCPRP